MTTGTEDIDREWREAREAEWGHGHGQALADYHHGVRKSDDALAPYPEQYRLAYRKTYDHHVKELGEPQPGGDVKGR